MLMGRRVWEKRGKEKRNENWEDKGRREPRSELRE
jgi:hypothetical protein